MAGVMPTLMTLSRDGDVDVAAAAVDSLGEVWRAAGAAGPAFTRVQAHFDSLLALGHHEVGMAIYVVSSYTLSSLPYAIMVTTAPFLSY